MIKFAVNFKTSVSSHVNLQRPEFRRLLNKNKIVTKNPIHIQYDYPLTIPLIKSYKTTKNGFTKSELIRLISADYKMIYREELSTSTVIPVIMDGSYNRNRTNGKYGIWGHALSDLELYRIWLINGVYMLQVDS